MCSDVPAGAPVDGACRRRRDTPCTVEGHPVDSGRRLPAPGTATALLAVLLALNGCGLKGDPLPPLPPPTESENESVPGAAPDERGEQEAQADGNAGDAEEDGEGNGEDGEGNGDGEENGAR